MVQTEPGDLILVRSRGAVFAAGRWLTGNAFDHVAVVVRDGMTLNIDKPMARALPLARVLRPELTPVVLRPSWRTQADRDAFVRWIERLRGAGYDKRRTFALLPRLLLRRLIGKTVPLRRPTPEAKRWICTDAVLLGLEQHAAGFEHLRDAAPDWRDLGAGTTNDFLAIARTRGDLLATLAG